MNLTFAQLHAIMPHCPADRAEHYAACLASAMAEASITTPARAAAFLAQVAHESRELKHFEELADGSAYEGATRLGNTQKGDGPKFKGRGPIQLTGRKNYTLAGAAL